MPQHIGARLKDISAGLDAGTASPTPTVREFLSWVGAQRRGYYIVSELREYLDEAGLETEPDFETVHIDTPIEFVRHSQKQEPAEESTGTSTSALEPATTELENEVPVFDDPRHRVSRLASASRAPLAISPNTSLEVVVTTMLVNDYSQLPVVSSPREVKGVVTWQGIAKRLSTGEKGTEARHFMDPPRIISHDESLLTAMREVAAHDYVLVRSSDQLISGIVTVTDISEQFLQLTEPFLLLGEIEQALRGLLAGVPKERLQAACDPRDTSRPVEGPADLTFGEYLRLLENPDEWAQLPINLDRTTFVQFLDDVRQIRNDVMHFDTDEMPETSKTKLRNLVRLLDWLRSRTEPTGRRA